MLTPLLRHAHTIGRELCRDAYWWKGRCNWHGDALLYHRGVSQAAHETLSASLYGGTAGIALFLSYLFRETGDKVVAQTARGAALHAAHSQGELGGDSFYSGRIGVLYTLYHVGILLDARDLTDQALENLRALTVNATVPTDDDVIVGKAGVIGALIDLQRSCGENLYTDYLTELGDALITSAVIEENRASWPSRSIPSKHNLTGFAHGVAGIAWSLDELFLETAVESYAELAAAAREYERFHFDQKKGNWPDFRPLNGMEPRASSMVAWCHGAPGIGLSRLRAYQLAPDQPLMEEISKALETTLAFLDRCPESGQNFSLCHGVFGNLEPLLASDFVFGNSNLTEKAQNIALRASEAQDARNLPWECGIAPGSYSPNLMVGAAGIGYMLLRIFSQCKIPSILVPGAFRASNHAD